MGGGFFAMFKGDGDDPPLKPNPPIGERGLETGTEVEAVRRGWRGVLAATLLPGFIESKPIRRKK